MVSRIELFLIAAILFFAGKGMWSSLSPDSAPRSTQNREMELHHLTFREVNQSMLLHTVTAREMVQYPQETVYTDFTLYTPDLTLRAPQAIQRERVIYLDHNATIIKKDGSRYYAGGVVYHTRNRQLNLTESFSFTNRYGDVNGTRMQYDINQKEMHGDSVKAAYEIE